MSELRRLALALLLSAAGCADGAENTQTALENEHALLLNYLETPQYRGPLRLRGLAAFGFEMSSIQICENASGPCRPHRNVDGLDQPCWLEFTRSAALDVERRLADGTYLTELTGRIATRPGMFGHLGAYTCQVEALEIHSLRRRETDLRSVWFGPELAGRNASRRGGGAD